MYPHSVKWSIGKRGLFRRTTVRSDAAKLAQSRHVRVIRLDACLKRGIMAQSPGPAMTAGKP